MDSHLGGVRARDEAPCHSPWPGFHSSSSSPAAAGSCGGLLRESCALGVGRGGGASESRNEDNENKESNIFSLRFPLSSTILSSLPSLSLSIVPSSPFSHPLPFPTFPSLPLSLSLALFLFLCLSLSLPPFAPVLPPFIPGEGKVSLAALRKPGRSNAAIVRRRRERKGEGGTGERIGRGGRGWERGGEGKGGDEEGEKRKGRGGRLEEGREREGRVG